MSDTAFFFIILKLSPHINKHWTILQYSSTYNATYDVIWYYPYHVTLPTPCTVSHITLTCAIVRILPSCNYPIISVTPNPTTCEVRNQHIKWLMHDVCLMYNTCRVTSYPFVNYPLPPVPVAAAATRSRKIDNQSNTLKAEPGLI